MTDSGSWLHPGLRGRTLLGLLAVLAVSALLACGSDTSSTGAVTPDQTPAAPPPAATSAPAPPSPGAAPPAGNNQQAFIDCMKQHGAPVPSPGAGGTGGSISGTSGGAAGPGGAPPTMDPKLAAALQACQSLANNGGGGSGSTGTGH